jgi:hypothetical protein
MPTTLRGYACTGWLQRCNLAVCIDYGKEGHGHDYIPPAQPYQVCDRDTSMNQVVGSACVYDSKMFAWSKNQLGYNLCVSSSREENLRPQNGSNPHPLLFHSGNQSGVYVFDENFEQPLTNSSAPWDEIINDVQSNACGVNKNALQSGETMVDIAPYETRMHLYLLACTNNMQSQPNSMFYMAGKLNLFTKWGGLQRKIQHARRQRVKSHWSIAHYPMVNG